MERILKLIKNKTFLYLLLFLFSLFLASASDSYDFDLYARLIVGEHILTGHGISYHDFLSYTPTHIWYDHEWGSSIFFYAFLKFLGNFGLVLLHAILLFITVFFITKVQKIQKHAYPFSLILIAIFMFMLSYLNPTIVRCHMFSFAFFSMFLYFLEKTRICLEQGKKTNIIWFIPLIILFWNNIHGGVVAGLGIVFIYMVCAIIAKKQWLKYFYVLLTSIPILIINPYGIDYLIFLISANLKTRTYITEWWGVFGNFLTPYYYITFAILLFILLAGLSKILRIKKYEITKYALLFVTLCQGLMHVKLLSLTTIVAASLFYNEVHEFFDKKTIKILNTIAAVIIIICSLCIPLLHPNEAKVDLIKFPVKETEFIKVNGLEGNILCAFGHGSYISYKLYPKNKIYMDGRYEEVYYDREFQALGEFETASENWQNFLNNYPTEILVIDKTIQVYPILSEHPDWVKIYEAEPCSIFVRKDNVKASYILPSNDIKYYKMEAFKHMDNLIPE